MNTWLVLLCAAFSGGLLQSSTGFGYSLICMSAYSLAVSYTHLTLPTT